MMDFLINLALVAKPRYSGSSVETMVPRAYKEVAFLLVAGVRRCNGPRRKQ